MNPSDHVNEEFSHKNAVVATCLNFAEESEAFDTLDEMILDYHNAGDRARSASSFFKIHSFICHLEEQGLITTDNKKHIQYLKEILANDGPEYCMTIQFKSNSFPDRKYRIGVCVRGNPLIEKI